MKQRLLTAVGLLCGAALAGQLTATAVKEHAP